MDMVRKSSCDCGRMWRDPETGGHARWCSFVTPNLDELDEWEDFYEYLQRVNDEHTYPED